MKRQGLVFLNPLRRKIRLWVVALNIDVFYLRVFGFHLISGIAAGSD